MAGRVARRRSRFLTVALVLAAVATLLGGTGAQGQEAILGTAQDFAVLGASTVTNTGPTVINGDLGLHPGTSVTGFPPGVVNGEVHVTDAVAEQAQIDARTAYNALQARRTTPPGCKDLTGQVLGQDVGTEQNPLPPGVYCFSSSAQLTGDLYLLGGGEYVFLIGSTLTTASNSSVIIVNGPQEGCNIFWAVGSSATLGTGTRFLGTIIAQASISANTGATVNGRLIALGGAVTLQSNVITRPECGDTTTTTSGDGTTTTTSGDGTTTTTSGDGTTTTTSGNGGTTTTTSGDGGTTTTTSGDGGTTTTTSGDGTTTTTSGNGGTTTTTSGDGGTTTTLLPGGGGQVPTTTGLQPTTTTRLAATTTTTAAPATTTTASSATTTTVRPGTTGTTAPGGGTGLGGAGGPDSLRAAGAGEALALTGPAHLQPMVIAALLALLLGAMMLMSSGPGVGGLLVAGGPQQGQRRGDAGPGGGRGPQRGAGTSQGVTPLAPARAQAQVRGESDSRRRDISPAEATRSALRSAESISWTLRLPEA